MKKINLNQTQTKTMLALIGSAVVCSGLFIGSRFILPDDTPIKNTWQTSSYSSRGYQVYVGDVTLSSVTGETFFTLVQNGTPKEGESIKLSLHSIHEDGSLTPIHNVSQLTLESQDIKNLKMTGYSFFWPDNTYHLQVTVTALDSENHLLNQQVIYLDQRKVSVQEEAFRMEMYVKQALDNYLAPVTDSSANQIQSPTATTPETSDKAPEEVTGDDIQTPNEEVQNPTGTLQQSYVIEESEEVQSDHVEEIVETETPQYTLADLEHQLSKAKEELTATPEDETLKQKVADLEKQIQEMKSVEAEMSSSDNEASESHE